MQFFVGVQRHALLCPGASWDGFLKKLIAGRDNFSHPLFTKSEGWLSLRIECGKGHGNSDWFEKNCSSTKLWHFFAISFLTYNNCLWLFNDNLHFRNYVNGLLDFNLNKLSPHHAIIIILLQGSSQNNFQFLTPFIAR